MYWVYCIEIRLYRSRNGSRAPLWAEARAPEKRWPNFVIFKKALYNYTEWCGLIGQLPYKIHLHKLFAQIFQKRGYTASDPNRNAMDCCASNVSIYSSCLYIFFSMGETHTQRLYRQTDIEKSEAKDSRTFAETSGTKRSNFGPDGFESALNPFCQLMKIE